MRTGSAYRDGARFAATGGLSNSAAAYVAAFVFVGVLVCLPTIAHALAPEGFIENRGQIDSAVRYYINGPRGSVYLTDAALVLAVTEDVDDPADRLHLLTPDERSERYEEFEAIPDRRGQAVWMRFDRANPSPQVETRYARRGRLNYLIGDDPAGWFTDVAVYEEIVCRDVWPGVDLVLRYEGGEITYEWEAERDADLAQVSILYDGADRVTRPSGDTYALETAFGTIVDERPGASGGRGRISMGEGGGGATGGQRSHLVYSTFLGGSGYEDDPLWCVAVTDDGYLYAGGRTESSDFPTTPGAYDVTYNSARDMFVSKLNQDGSDLVYSTFIGGSNNESVSELVVDGSGNAYIIGITGSTDIPTTGYDTSFNGGDGDAYVAKLNSTGSSLVFGTYLGGSGRDVGRAIAVDGSEYAYVCGETYSADFPTTPGCFDDTHGGTEYVDSFATKFNTAGTALEYSTFVSCEYNDAFMEMTVDGSGNAYLTGWAGCSDFPVTSGS